MSGPPSGPPSSRSSAASRPASSRPASSKLAPSATTRLPPPGSRALYIIDLSNHVHRAYHGIAPLSTTKGEPTHAVMGTVMMLQRVVGERRPEMVAIAMDSKEKSWRKELDPRYKANRPPAPPDLIPQLERCEQIARAYNIPIYRIEGLEADDLMASLVARADKEGVPVVIVSTDKDLMQLVHDGDERVLLWDTMHNKVYGPAEVQEKLGVRPSQVVDYLALVGDSSDNVPGVRSVGPKTATELLAQFGTLEGIYAHLPEVKRDKLREKLAEHEVDARLSRRLVDLERNAPIDWDDAHLRWGGANVSELRALFTELELGRMLDRLPPPPVVARSYTLLSDLAALDAAIARAKEKKQVAVEAYGSGPDPMRADVIGVALSTAPGEGLYAPIGHRYLGVPKQLPWPEVRARLAALLGDPSVRKIGTDLKTTEVLLARHGVDLGEPTWDVSIASYILDPELDADIGEIARRELNYGIPALPQKLGELESLEVEKVTDVAGARVEACSSGASRLMPKVTVEKLGPLMDDVERPLARVLAKMEMAGVLVDVAVLEGLGKKADVELRALEEKGREIVGRDFSIRSRDQLEAILFDEIGLPSKKRTAKGGRSTDAEVLEELDHPLAHVVLEHRELDKLKGTYLDALPRCVNPATGRIHTRFEQTRAATGRLSSRDPNLQNIPVRTELGREVRKAFVAPPGHKLVCADYSQIELRVLAHLSRDPVLLETYAKDEDVHVRTASLIFDVPIEAVTADQRRAAKTINFGVIYGMGEAALARQIDVKRDVAARFIEAYFRRYEGVARFMHDTVEAARRGEAVRTVLGRRRFLPNLKNANRALRAEAERIAKNTPIQGTAADILKIAMVRLGAMGAPEACGAVVPGARMVLTVHDELVFEVPDAKVEEAKARVREVMAGAMKLDVALVVDVGAGVNWAEAK